MKIFVLKEKNNARTVCVSEDIQLIRKSMCDKTYFDPEEGCYPVLSIWENGVETENVEGGMVLRKIAENLKA